VIPFPTVPRAAPPPPPPAPAPAEAANTFKFDEAAPEDAPTETVARARRQPSSQTGPLAIVGIFLFMIVLPVAILAMLVVNPVMLYWEGKAAGPKIDVQDRTPARLKVTPGWASSLYLRDGRSVTGLWATTGLELVLDQEVPGAGQRFPVAPPTLQSWGETITVVERRGSGRSNQETTIPATFQAPSNLPSSGEALRGRIVGQVTAPRLTEGGQFTTATDTVEAPIELDIVSAPSLLLDRFLASLSLYLQEDRWLLVTIGALLCWCVLAGMTAIAMRMAAVLGGSD